MTTFYLVVMSVTTLWTVFGIVAIAKVCRRRAEPLNARTPISVLKPLCGVDNDLEGNLRTFFRQDYANFELVFGIQGHADPAIPIVARLRREFSHVRSRLVIHEGGRGINPKVSNLRAMLSAVSHDVVVVSDSNISVSPTYLREMIAELDQKGVGLVTNLFTGTGEESLGARVESLHLNGTIAAGNALPTVFLDMPVVVGKSMMFRRSTFERLGGFESVKNLLAEDYVIGRMFHIAGYEIRMARQPIRNVCKTTTLSAFMKRHLRWGMIRLRLTPLAFVLEPLTIPLFVALAAPLFGANLTIAIVWALALTLLRDTAQWITLRGKAGLAKALPLLPLRDLLVLATWAITPFFRHISWRGNRVRVSAGTHLYAEQEPAAPSALVIENAIPKYES